MIISYIFIYFILCLWIYWLWTRRKFYSLMFKIPGRMGYPLLGIALQFRRKEDILPVLENDFKIYGSIFFSWLGPYPFLLLTDPNLLREVLTSRYCNNKAVLYESVAGALGNNLITLKDPTWSVHRKLLNPAFSYKNLMSFLPIFNSEVNELLKKVEQMRTKVGVDLIKVLQDFTLNTATKTTMGKSVLQEIKDNELFFKFYILLDIMSQMMFSPWLNYTIMQRLTGIYTPYNEAKKITKNIVQKLIERNLNQENDVRDSTTKNIFIDIAIDLLKRKQFSYQDVESESIVIVAAAFETTANTIANTLMLLAMFPEYQEKVFEELCTIFPNQGDFEVTYDNIKDMSYMDMVLNESMRVMAPVPIIARQVSQDFRLSNGVTLPKGLQIAIDIFHMHRREDIWGPDAKLFNPDHFLPTNLEDKHPYAFIPFAKGLRDCIGYKYGQLSVKMVLAKLLRNYYFSTDMKYEDLVFVAGMSIKLKRNPLLRIEKRNI